MAEPKTEPDTDAKPDGKEQDQQLKFELIEEAGVFKDMYIKDINIQNRIQEILESAELKELKDSSKRLGRSLELFDEVVPEEPAPLTFFQRLKRSLKLFKEVPEYGSKEAYLVYIKSAYKFMVIPLEERPGLLSRIFYHERSAAWKPSPDDARELLEKFYLEAKMIRALPDRDWVKVKTAKDPEAALNTLLYGIRFKPEFQSFLHKIPWIMSRDRYGAPALDLVFWNPPGTKMPQKPVSVDDEFIDKLVQGVKDHQSYARIEIDDKFVELKSRKQILDTLEKDERVLIDSYVGVSKIERDFVLHKRLILWRNIGYERYEKQSKLERMRGATPMPYLVMLQEKAQPLEISFVTSESK